MCFVFAMLFYTQMKKREKQEAKQKEIKIKDLQKIGDLYPRCYVAIFWKMLYKSKFDIFPFYQNHKKVISVSSKILQYYREINKIMLNLFCHKKCSIKITQPFFNIQAMTTNINFK